MRLLLLTATAACLTGCRFWYKPVPVADAIGKERTVLAAGGDSLNVHREDRFEIYGPDVDAVYDGYEQLNRAGRAFQHYFEAPVPRLAVILTKDAPPAVDEPTLRRFRESGFDIVRYVRPGNVRRRYSGLNYGGTLWPVAPAAARAMLVSFARTTLAKDSVVPDDALLDRFPLWYRAAVMHLVGEAGSATNDLDYVRDNSDDWIPLQTLLTLVRPSAADSTLDPSRRGEADAYTRMAAAEASIFGRYLAELEGPAVLGSIARAYLAGRSLAEILDAFRVATHAVPELERRWRLWIAMQEY